MQVILLEKVDNLGSLGDQVDVKPGYARNFLIPKNKAVSATKENVESFQSTLEIRQKKLEDIISEARSKAQAINKLCSITIHAKSSEEGKLFGSIGSRDIVDAIKDAGIEISKSIVRLPNGILRRTGQYEVSFQLYSGISSKIIVNVARKH